MHIAVNMHCGVAGMGRASPEVPWLPSYSDEATIRAADSAFNTVVLLRHDGDSEYDAGATSPGPTAPYVAPSDAVPGACHMV